MTTIGEITYKRIKQIGVGQGLNSKVYLVDDLQLGAYMVAKEIDKTLILDPNAYFLETQIMFATAHENVVSVQYSCQPPGIISLIMPYFSKGSLASRIETAPLPLCEVLRVMQGVLAGTAFIHSRGYIHFDIKPSNVLFSDKNVPMVSDFGQSRAISATGVVKVPPLYKFSIPPETIGTNVATTLADIYHLGLLMYRCLNGDKFFHLQTPSAGELLQKTKKGKFPNRKKFMPHVPKRLRTIVRKALQTDPAKRFQTPYEMADALGRVEIQLDWSVEAVAPNGFRWRALRPGLCDFVVELSEQSAAWTIQTFTEGPGGLRRAKDEAENWRNGLSLDAAYAHLEEVFERLLQ